MKKVLMALCVLSSVNAFADIRDSAVLKSPMIKAIQAGFKAEQGLTCVITKDSDSGDYNIEYFDENNLSKFRAYLTCRVSDGLTAIVVGTIGDSGSTAVESMSMETGVN